MYLFNFVSRQWINVTFTCLFQYFQKKILINFSKRVSIVIILILINFEKTLKNTMNENIAGTYNIFYITAKKGLCLKVFSLVVF